MVHDNELRRKYNLSLEFIKELILEFNPDVICGEVLPDSWEKYNKDSTHQGYWGEPATEYWDLIFPLCEEEKYEFVPVDWVELDVWMDFEPFNSYDEHQRQELNVELEHMVSETAFNMGFKCYSVKFIRIRHYYETEVRMVRTN